MTMNIESFKIELPGLFEGLHQYELAMIGESPKFSGSKGKSWEIINYEFVQMWDATACHVTLIRLLSERHVPRGILNSTLESALLHVRSLLEFMYKDTDGSASKVLRAVNFVNDPNEWKTNRDRQMKELFEENSLIPEKSRDFPQHLPWERLYKRLCQDMAHLDSQREKRMESQSKGCWKITVLVNAICGSLFAFTEIYKVDGRPNTFDDEWFEVLEFNLKTYFSIEKRW